MGGSALRVLRGLATLLAFGSVAGVTVAATQGTAHAAIDGYDNPLRSIGNLSISRVDSGVDYNGTGPVYAIGDGVIDNLYALPPPLGWPNAVFIAYHLTDGPANGLEVYTAEYITPSVTIGQSVNSNTVIGEMFEKSDGSGGIEIGWADPVVSRQQSMAKLYGQWHEQPGYSSAFGYNFDQMLMWLGAPGGVVHQPIQGTLPTGWPTWPPPNVKSVPVSLYDSHGNANLFWTDGSGALRHDYALAGKPWVNDGIKAGYVATDPAAVATSTGGLDVFYGLGNGVLQHSYFLGGVWTNNQPMPNPGPIAGTPTAYIDSHGVENVFWRGPSGQLFHDYFLGGHWYGQQLATNLASDPVGLALPSGNADVFYKINGGGLQHSYFAGGKWTNNKSLPLPGAVAGRPTAYLSTDHHEHVLWRGTGGQLFHDYFIIGSTTGWHADAQRGANLTSDPTALRLTNAGGDIFYETTGGALQHSFFVKGIWTTNKTLQSFKNVDTKPSAMLRSGHENVFWIDNTATPWNDWNPGTGWQGPATLPN
jgi:hypothetical protein